jgi:ubiquinone/menaquinone biosynthesis C-methylase UbiE
MRGPVYTLCSVDDQRQVLAELRRVLRPGGRLLYLEHGRAPDPRPAMWQRLIEPGWKWMIGNCHLTRPIGKAVTNAGFAVEPMGERYTPRIPEWLGQNAWHVRDWA